MIVVTEVEKKVDEKKNTFFIKEKAYVILIHTEVLKRQTH